MPMTNDIERLHRRIAELEARVAALEGVTDDGWITWDGGECPVDGRQLVECYFRDGDTEMNHAGAYEWSHNGGFLDIIAYRVVK